MIKTKRMMVLDNSHRITVTNCLTPNQSDGGDTLNPELLTLNQRTGTDALGDTSGFTPVFADSTVYTSSTEEAHSGSRSLKVVTPGEQANEGVISAYPTATVVNGTTYVAGCWIKSDAVGRTIRLTATGGLTGANFTITGEWQWLEITGTATGTSLYLHIKNPNDDGAMTFYVDDLRLAKNDTTGFGKNAGDETFTITGETSYQGYRSLKVVTPGSVVREGTYITQAGLTVGQTYTLSGRIFAPAGSTIRIEYMAPHLTLTGTGAWQSFSLTGIATGTTHYLVFATVTSAQAITFNLDSLMFQTGSKAHDWIIGQSSYSFFRSRE